jgi:ribosomal protein S18 acetylase RimI-like enzyme
MRIRRATMQDLNAVVADHAAFWGERDVRAIHHPLLIHEFGDFALVAQEREEPVAGYLFGMLTPKRVGYIHIVAVRDGHRRDGLARRLYGEFAGIAERSGATALKAFTRPENETSIAFHSALGFAVQEVPNYAWGEMRVVFTRPVA